MHTHEILKPIVKELHNEMKNVMSDCKIPIFTLKDITKLYLSD